MEITNQDQTQFKQTYGNKLWRLENLYKIRNKNKQLTNLKLNNIQKRMLADIGRDKPIKAFFLKYRQGGVSTFWLLYWLDETIFTRNTVTGILADKKENLGYLFEIVRLAHEYMPDNFRPRLGEDSKSALSFPDINSKIMVSLSIKSTALHNLHVSEWCYCEDDEIARTLAACSPTANITGESTGNGIGNHGYELYQDAKRGESPFKAAFYPWYIQEEYRLPLNGIDTSSLVLTKDERRLTQYMEHEYGLKLDPEQLLFRRAKQKELKGLYRQEFPETDEDAFLTSGNKFFEPRKVHRLLLEAKEMIRQTPPWQEDKDEDFIAWEKPTPKHVYAAGADTSEGSHDYSVLKIICVTCRREAFVYRARCGVDVFYRACDKWGREYRNALMAVERNNHGHAVLLGLDEIMHYPNLYKQENVTRPIVGNDQKVTKIGWQTDKTSKPLMLDELKYAIEGDSSEDEDHFLPEFRVMDQTLLSECLTFEQVDGKLQAIEGKFDDDVIATSIAYQMYKRLKRYVPAYRQEDETAGVFFGSRREEVL